MKRTWKMIRQLSKFVKKCWKVVDQRTVHKKLVKSYVKEVWNWLKFGYLAQFNNRETCCKKVINIWSVTILNYEFPNIKNCISSDRSSAEKYPRRGFLGPYTCGKFFFFFFGRTPAVLNNFFYCRLFEA